MSGGIALQLPDTNRLELVYERPAAVIADQYLDYEGQPSNVRGAKLIQGMTLGHIRVTIAQTEGSDFTVELIGDTEGTLATVTVTAGQVSEDVGNLGVTVPAGERLSVKVTAGAAVRPRVTAMLMIFN